MQPPVGATGGPRFVANTLRTVFSTEAFELSRNFGQLAIMARSTFEVFGVGGAQGEAIVLYNNDGTLL